MVQTRTISANSFLIYLLIAVFVLNMLHGEANGKLLFCKGCRSTRSTSDPVTIAPNTSQVNTGAILNAPVKCRPGQVPDKRNICRKLVFNQSTGEDGNLFEEKHRGSALWYINKKLLPFQGKTEQKKQSRGFVTIYLHLKLYHNSKECKYLIGKITSIALLTALVCSLASKPKKKKNIFQDYRRGKVY